MKMCRQFQEGKVADSTFKSWIENDGQFLYNGWRVADTIIARVLNRSVSFQPSKKLSGVQHSIPATFHPIMSTKFSILLPKYLFPAVFTNAHDNYNCCLTGKFAAQEWKERVLVFPINPFQIVEPQHQDIGEFYAIHERHAADFETPKL